MGTVVVVVSNEGGGPIRIPPPTVVRIAAYALAGECAGVLLIAVLVVAGQQDADLKWALATASYFLVLAALMAAVCVGLLRGRRWARTPGIVIGLIVALCGFYLAVPSEQLLPGLAVTAVGVATVGLLVSRPANDWISSFPSLFGPTDG